MDKKIIETDFKALLLMREGDTAIWIENPEAMGGHFNLFVNCLPKEVPPQAKRVAWLDQDGWKAMAWDKATNHEQNGYPIIGVYTTIWKAGSSFYIAIGE